MNKYITFLVLIVLFVSCKRDKEDVIGPSASYKVASADFSVTNQSFSWNLTNQVNFQTADSAGIWFNAGFNESVSWTITIRGTTSKAVKVITGISDTLNKTNTLWKGGHSGLYFFTEEVVIAELSVLGRNEKLYDTLKIVGQRINWGSDVIVWYDMDKQGKSVAAGWYDWYAPGKAGDSCNAAVIGCGARLADWSLPHTDNDPVQGIYRSQLGVDGDALLGVGFQNYYIGGIGNNAVSPAPGFDAPLNMVYLNFYLRGKTSNSSMSGTITSGSSTLSFNVPQSGKIDWQGWKLISIQLSTMALGSNGLPFDPKTISLFAAQIGDYNGISGYDIDFITITKGPFNPDVY